MTTVAEINDVTLRYGKLTALDKVSFAVNEGELFGLIGPDGAGKSTMYKIMATLLNPDSGNVNIFGLDTVKDYRQIRTMIGYMPERFSLYPDLSVSENLNFFASLFGVKVKDNYDLIAPFFGQLEKFPDRKAGALSGGMKQKLALSCALIHRPKILLLDEPTTGVDAVSRSEFWDMLDVLKESGISIIVSTSYMDEATRCEKIAMINNGRIMRIDTPEGLVKPLKGELYGAKSKDMFTLLTRLRCLPEVKECYTFGASLHILAGEGFSAESCRRKIYDAGIEDVKIFPTEGTIEDLFIISSTDGNNKNEIPS